MPDSAEISPGSIPVEDRVGPAPTETVTRLLNALDTERRLLRELLDEHRDLHEQNIELVQQLLEAPDGGPSGDSDERLRQTEVRCELLKAENTELVANYQKVLEESNNLFKLYIASNRLHSTLALGGVLDVISEIVLNLVGADCYSIMFYDEAERQLAPVLVRGIERDLVQPVRPGAGVIGSAVNSDRPYLVSEPANDGSFSPEWPLAVIPLRNPDRLLGAIVLYRLLSHKPKLRDVDHQLFEYLATHAAMALHSAQLYTASERKVSKMKEFLTLMGEESRDA